MSGRLEGKVAFITGGAKGQGRSHAVRFAQEGADIIVVDLLGDIPSTPYAQGTEADLAETVRQVEALDHRIIARQADVRDYDGLKAALDEAVAELGHLDIVSANAGIINGFVPSDRLTTQEWQDVIDVDLTGVWNTTRAAIPHLRANGGGSMTLTSSIAALRSSPNVIHYNAAKMGVVAIARTLSLELAKDSIRVNTVAPTTLGTDMTYNEPTYRLFRPDLENPTKEDFEAVVDSINPYPVGLIEAIDVSNAVLFLSSDEARYITGATLPVSAGSAS